MSCELNVQEEKRTEIQTALDNIINHWQEEGYNLRILNVHNSAMDTVVKRAVDFNKELTLFKETAINGSQIGKYEKDDLGHIVIWNLKSNHKSNVKRVELLKEGDEVKTLKFAFKQYNNLGQINYSMELDRSKGYLIKGVQYKVMSDTINYRIEGVLEKE